VSGMAANGNDPTTEWRLNTIEARVERLDNRTQDMPEQIRGIREDIGEIRSVLGKAIGNQNRVIFALVSFSLTVAASTIALLLTVHS